MPPPLSRRAFFRLAAGLPFPLLALGRSGWVQGRPEQDRPGPAVDWLDSRGEAVLVAAVDTLVPADDTPGASELGAPSRVARWMGAERRTRLLLQMGLRRLDRVAQRQGKPGFAELAADDRAAVLGRFEAGEHGRAGRALFEGLRYHTMRAYYASPDAWPGVGFNGPPQPRGYPGFAGPPEEDRG